MGRGSTATRQDLGCKDRSDEKDPRRCRRQMVSDIFHKSRNITSPLFFDIEDLGCPLDTQVYLTPRRTPGCQSHVCSSLIIRGSLSTFHVSPHSCANSSFQSIFSTCTSSFYSTPHTMVSLYCNTLCLSVK